MFPASPPILAGVDRRERRHVHDIVCDPRVTMVTFGLPDMALQNVDALSRNGEIYSIKTVTSRRGTTGSFWDPSSIENNTYNLYSCIIKIDPRCPFELVN